MKCYKCPLFSSWNNEADKGECCGLFGDSWDNPLQYEDKEGTIQGCYVDKHYIDIVDRRYNDYLEQEVATFVAKQKQEAQNAEV